MAVIQDVVKGDIIVERVAGKKRMIPVRKVEFNTCSKPSVHINNNACYDWGTQVQLADGEGTLADLQDATDELGELEDDIMASRTGFNSKKVGLEPNPHLRHVHIPNGLNHDELAELLVKH